MPFSGNFYDNWQLHTAKMPCSWQDGQDNSSSRLICWWLYLFNQCNHHIRGCFPIKTTWFIIIHKKLTEIWITLLLTLFEFMACITLLHQYFHDVSNIKYVCVPFTMHMASDESWVLMLSLDGEGIMSAWMGGGLDGDFRLIWLRLGRSV